MKKLTKLDIEALKKEMPVLDEETRRNINGGYDQNDCWWHCIAYLKSGGKNYKDADAYALACAYYGSSFDPNSYGFYGNFQGCNNYISNYVTCSGCGDYTKGSILVVNSSLILDGVGNNSGMHAVIVTSYGSSVGVFDPSTGQTKYIATKDIASSSGHFYVRVN